MPGYKVVAGGKRELIRALILRGRPVGEIVSRTFLSRYLVERTVELDLPKLYFLYKQNNETFGKGHGKGGGFGLLGKTYEEIFGAVGAIKRSEITSDWMRERNIINAPGAVDKMSESKKKFYASHPEKHPNYILAGLRTYKSSNVSGPQLEMFYFLSGVFSDCRLNYPLVTPDGVRFIDVAVPSLKFAFEYDEPYWHSNKGLEAYRRNLVVGSGWSILSFRSLGEVKSYIESKRDISYPPGRRNS